MQHNLEPAITQHTIQMPSWHVELTIVLTPEGPYFLIRQLCGVLGVANVGQMLQRMREDDTLPGFMHQWPVQTRGGRQQTWCLHKRAVGYWLAMINTAKVRREFQPRLKDLKRECLDLMDRLFWGEVESTATALIPSPAPALPAIAQQTEENTVEIQHTQDLLLHLEERIGALEDRVYLPSSDDE